MENGSHPGVKTALTKTEEDGLVSYLIYMAQRGFPLTRTMVKAFAWAIAKRSGNDHRFVIIGLILQKDTLNTQTH